ncbi:DUF924 family protein [Thiomicrorhabdus sp.]|uniref:DUF924 family protein n=1 Tax=Thiomicrorhabdus sp. TaxID=2039724 RepID=UPI0035613297
MTTATEIIDYWYTPPMPKHWFRSTPGIDAQIRARYESLWEKAANGELDDWKQTAEGCLALCIVLDQFPLNMFRGEAKSFATEEKAVAVSKYSVANGLDLQLSAERRAFLYMPLMHSENLDDQEESVRLFGASELEGNLRFARHHRELIRRFGRFPHRNAILGRENTVDEKEYLSSTEAFTG